AAPVLAEEHRVLALPDVVIVGADPRQQGIGADLGGGGFHQRPADDAMVIGAGRLDDEVLEQWMVEARKLEEPDAGDIAENRLQEARGEEHHERREEGPRDERSGGGGERLRLVEAALEEGEGGEDANAGAGG